MCINVTGKSLDDIEANPGHCRFVDFNMPFMSRSATDVSRLLL